jgi:predicted nucleic acid-binding protein
MATGIKTKDALHIACAILANSDAFITTDDKILRRYKKSDIKICKPITFFDIYGREII